MNHEDFLKYFTGDSLPDHPPVELSADTRAGLHMANEGALGMFAMMQAMIDAGFTREEAFELIKITLTLGALGDMDDN